MTEKENKLFGRTTLVVAQHAHMIPEITKELERMVTFDASEHGYYITNITHEVTDLEELDDETGKIYEYKQITARGYGSRLITELERILDNE